MKNGTVISAVSKLYFDKDMSILSKARLHMYVLIYLLNITEKKLLIPQIIYDEHTYEKWIFKFNKVESKDGDLNI